MTSSSSMFDRWFGDRARSVIALACGLGMCAFAGASIAEEAAQRVLAGSGDSDAVGEGFQRPVSRYHGHGEVCALIDAWIAADVRVEAVDLGATREGRRVPALRFCSQREAGSQTRTVMLVGGLDGRSQAGCEAVLWSTWELLAQLDHLPSDLNFIALPWAAPDGLARTHRGLDWSGRNTTPVDDDGDGLTAEDGPDDLDGDGLVLQMAVPDPEHGAWCFAEDHRFLVPAGPGDAPRYTLTREGRDDDLDGAFNEDATGGVDFNAHFPVGWDRVRLPGARGAWPLSEAVPRRIADLCLDENVALCVSFVGAHGGIDFGRRWARPSVEEPDSMGARTVSSSVEQRIRLAFGRVTGRLGSSPDAGRAPSGRLVDWVASTLPCVALEVAVWGPDVVGVDGRPFEARIQRMPGQVDRSSDPLATGRALGPVDAAWAFWLDDIRGGVGFQDWHPVDLGKGRTGWVGGWEPRSRLNPPETCLPAALEGLPRFVQELSVGLPRLELEVLSVQRVGDLVQIDAQVTNRGGLETDLIERSDAGGVTVSLRRIRGEDVVAGSLVTVLDPLGPGESSRTLHWLVKCKPGARIQIHASTPTAPVVLREVRP